MISTLLPIIMAWGEYSLANDLVYQRKMLERDLVNLLGKDLSGAITDKSGRGVKSLMNGNYKAFDQVLSREPADMRQEQVLTVLNGAFTQGSRKEKVLNIPGFVDWYQGLMRNPYAMKRITGNIPREASERLSNIYEVANGIRQVKMLVAMCIKNGSMHFTERATGNLACWIG